MGSDTSSTSHLQGAFGMDLLVLGSNSDRSLSSSVFITRSFGTGVGVCFLGWNSRFPSSNPFSMRMTIVTERHFSTHGETQQDGASKLASGLFWRGKHPVIGAPPPLQISRQGRFLEAFGSDDTQRFLRRLVSNESICYGLVFSRYPSYVFF